VFQVNQSSKMAQNFASKSPGEAIRSTTSSRISYNQSKAILHKVQSKACQNQSAKYAGEKLWHHQNETVFSKSENANNCVSTARSPLQCEERQLAPRGCIA